MAFSGSQTTRVAHNGTYTRLTGSFAGKTPESGAATLFIKLVGIGGGLIAPGGLSGRGQGLIGRNT